MIFTVFFWVGITLAGLWGTIFLVTHRKPDDWNGMIFLALIIPLLETSRYWVLFISESRWLQFGWRVSAAVISMILLFAYAHFRLGLERMREKLLVATLYPGTKLLLFIVIEGFPKSAR